MTEPRTKNQEKQELQGNTVISVDYIPSGNNQTWRQGQKDQEGYFTLHDDHKSDKFLTAFNKSTMDILGRFLIIYQSFFGSFWSYLI